MAALVSSTRGRSTSPRIGPTCPARRSAATAWSPTPRRRCTLPCALHALVEGQYFAALEFAEMVLTDPVLRRAPRLLPDGPPPVVLADLRDAMEQIRARPAKG